MPTLTRDGPPLEQLLHRLAESPADILAEPRVGQGGQVHVAAVVGDLLASLGARPSNAALAPFADADAGPPDVDPPGANPPGANPPDALLAKATLVLGGILGGFGIRPSDAALRSLLGALPSDALAPLAAPDAGAADASPPNARQADLAALVRSVLDSLDVRPSDAALRSFAATYAPHVRSPDWRNTPPLAASPLAAPPRSALPNTARSRNSLSVTLLLCWLLADPWFADAPPGTGELLRLLDDGARELAATPARRFVDDPDRREEMARVALAAFGMRPAGETRAQAEDRLTSLSSVERARVVAAARDAEQRARAIREALRRKAAQESADKWTRD